MNKKQQKYLETLIEAGYRHGWGRTARGYLHNWYAPDHSCVATDKREGAAINKAYQHYMDSQAQAQATVTAETSDETAQLRQRIAELEAQVEKHSRINLKLADENAQLTADYERCSAIISIYKRVFVSMAEESTYWPNDRFRRTAKNALHLSDEEIQKDIDAFHEALKADKAAIEARRKELES